MPTSSFGQADVQIVHNSGDPAARVVDIYVEDDQGTLITDFDDFTYRDATGFLDLPAGDYEITVAQPSSTGPDNQVVDRFSSITLNDGVNYTVLANGVVGSGFESNPDGNNIAFDLDIATGARETADTPNDGDVEIRAAHGATDAPTVDILAGGSVFVDNASYTDITGYQDAPAQQLTLEVTPGNDNSNTLFSFDADLSGFANTPLTVIASGFASPGNEGASPLAPFTLIAVAPNGDVIDLGAAKAQIVHNSGDPAAEIVDIYVDGQLALEDFKYRSASGFIGLDSGVRDIAVAPAGSQDSSDAVAQFSRQVPANSSLSILANGVIGSSFESNPDGEDVAFDLDIATGARETADTPNDGDVEIRAAHGATDAPTVDILAGGSVFVDNASYTDITGYQDAPAQQLTLEVTPGNDNSNTLFSFDADLSGFANTPLTVIASGFASPGNEGASPLAPFTLIAVAPNGNVIDLGAARVQVIHNSPDPAAGTVDIYVDGGKPAPLDDLSFQDATAYLDVPSGVRDIAVAGSNSSDTTGAAAQFTKVVPRNGTVSIIASGVLNPSNFESNPNGVNTGFELLTVAGARETPQTSGNAEFRVVHGAPDAPTVDATVVGPGLTVADDVAYTNVTGYTSVGPGTFSVAVTGPNGNISLATFTAPLTSSGTATVLASGFYTPYNDPDGGTPTQPAFGLVVAFADGSTATLPVENALAINEFLADPTTSSGGVDANGDGTIEAEDEFVEIINRSQSGVNVSGYKIVDNAGNEYEFPSNTTIPAGEAATIFRGGSPTGIPGFTDTGLPALNNGGDDIILQDDQGDVVQRLRYPVSGAVPESEGVSTARNVNAVGGFAPQNEFGTQNNASPGENNDSGNALPVELAGFSAALDGTDAVLQWRTLSEQNNSGFAVQQQGPEASSFEQVGFRDGQGTTSGETSYRFRVSDLAAGTHAFRLKQVDLDGSSTLSDEVTVEVTLDKAFSLSKARPNPISGTGTVSLEVRETQDVTVELFDVLGRQVRTLYEGTLTSGDRHQMTIQGTSLSNGTYLLRVNGESFSNTQKITVVK